MQPASNPLNFLDRRTIRFQVSSTSWFFIEFSCQPYSTYVDFSNRLNDFIFIYEIEMIKSQYLITIRQVNCFKICHLRLRRRLRPSGFLKTISDYVSSHFNFNGIGLHKMPCMRFFIRCSLKLSFPQLEKMPVFFKAVHQIEMSNEMWIVDVNSDFGCGCCARKSLIRAAIFCILVFGKPHLTHLTVIRFVDFVTAQWKMGSFYFPSQLNLRRFLLMRWTLGNEQNNANAAHWISCS